MHASFVTPVASVVSCTALVPSLFAMQVYMYTVRTCMPACLLSVILFFLPASTPSALGREGRDSHAANGRAFRRFAAVAAMGGPTPSSLRNPPGPDINCAETRSALP